MLDFDFGPHEETEKTQNGKIIRTFHKFPECNDDDKGQKYNHFYMKEVFFENDKIVKTETGKNIFVNDKNDELNAAIKVGIKAEKEIEKETSERINLV